MDRIWYYFFLAITKIPAASKTMPAIIPVIAEKSPILPATNIEVGPSAPPMIATDLANDICPFLIKIKLIAAITIPITVNMIPAIFLIPLPPQNLDFLNSRFLLPYLLCTQELQVPHSSTYLHYTAEWKKYKAHIQETVCIWKYAVNCGKIWCNEKDAVAWMGRRGIKL